MVNENRLSFRASIYAVLTGREEIDEASVPSGFAAFHQADDIISEIVIAASEGLICFHGIPSQTKFLIDDTHLDHERGDGSIDPGEALSFATSHLRRPRTHLRNANLRHQTHVSRRLLPVPPEPIPASAWRQEGLCWEAEQLLLWQAPEIDTRFEDIDPEWQDGPIVSAPDYDPMRISGYNEISTSTPIPRQLLDNVATVLEATADKHALSSTKAGRPAHALWVRVDEAAKRMLDDGRIPTGTWDEVFRVVLDTLRDEGFSSEDENEMTKLRCTTWTKRLGRAEKHYDSTLRKKLNAARQRPS